MESKVETSNEFTVVLDQAAQAKLELVLNDEGLMRAAFVAKDTVR